MLFDLMFLFEALRDGGWFLTTWLDDDIPNPMGWNHQLD